MREKEEGPLTNTEMLACFVGRRIPLNEIRCMAYESGKRQAKFHLIFRPKEASKWASEWVRKFDEELDSIFL